MTGCCDMESIPHAETGRPPYGNSLTSFNDSFIVTTRPSSKPRWTKVKETACYATQSWLSWLLTRSCILTANMWPSRSATRRRVAEQLGHDWQLGHIQRLDDDSRGALSRL